MASKVQYTNPTTGLKAVSAAAPDPKIEWRFTGRGQVQSDHLEPYIVTDNTTYPFALPIHEEINRIEGAPFVPHARLDGKQAYLKVAANSSATQINVEQYLTPDGRPIFDAGCAYWLMHRLPYPEEEGEVETNAAIDAELIVIDAAYDWTTDGGTGTNSGAWPTVSALATTRQKWAVVQKAIGCTASYNLDTGELGYRPKLEQLTVISISEAADGGGSNKIDVDFTENTDAACHGYAIQILKKGDALCVDDEPVSVPEWVIPTQISAKSALTPTLGVISVNALGSYYSSATRKLETITAGVYYVCVRALNQTTIDANLRMSAASVEAVTVA